MKGSALVQGLQRLPQALQFALVGASAAATHLLVVGLLVHGTGMAPLVANGLAFVVAFGVSYNGHALLTFARTQVRGWAVVARYLPWPACRLRSMKCCTPQPCAGWTGTTWPACCWCCCWWRRAPLS